MLLFIIGLLLPFYKNCLLKGNQKFVLLKMIFVKTDTKLKWDLLPYKTLKTFWLRCLQFLWFNGLSLWCLTPLWKILQ